MTAYNRYYAYYRYDWRFTQGSPAPTRNRTSHRPR